MDTTKKFFSSITGEREKRIEWAFVISIVIFTTIVYSFINWQKHIHFQTFGWDTAVFDQQVYLISIGKTPYSSLHSSLYNLPQVHALTDHFHPLVLIFGALLYKIWADPRMLFILQSGIIALSGIPLYLIAKYLLSKISLPSIGLKTISFSLMILYLFSVSTQAMTLDEFHDDVLVTLPLLFSLYCILTCRMRWYWILFCITLLTKEEYGLLGIPLAFFIALQKRSLKQALATAIVGISTFYLLLYIVMPSFSGTSQYAHFRAENKPSYIINQLVTHPTLLVSKFLDHPEKRKTFIVSLVSFGFLPLFSGPAMILPLFSVAIRFFDETTVRRYEFNNHYASPAISFFAFVSVISLSYVLSYLIKRKKASPRHIWVPVIVFLLIVLIIQDGLFHGPINSLFKKSFYETQPFERDAHELIRKIPPHSPLATQNSLLPHVSQREHFYLLPEIGNAQFIAVDLTEGPNKFASSSAIQIERLTNKLIEEKTFTIIWQKNKSILLERL